MGSGYLVQNWMHCGKLVLKMQIFALIQTLYQLEFCGIGHLIWSCFYCSLCKICRWPQAGNRGGRLANEAFVWITWAPTVKTCWSCKFTIYSGPQAFMTFKVYLDTATGVTMSLELLYLINHIAAIIEVMGYMIRRDQIKVNSSYVEVICLQCIKHGCPMTIESRYWVSLRRSKSW